MCIALVFRTRAWPAASRGAVQRLSGTHKSSQPHGCSGEGAVSKSTQSALGGLKPQGFGMFFPSGVVNFIIKWQISLLLSLPKILQHFLSRIRCQQSCVSAPLSVSLTAEKKTFSKMMTSYSDLRLTLPSPCWLFWPALLFIWISDWFIHEWWIYNSYYM